MVHGRHGRHSKNPGAVRDSSRWHAGALHRHVRTGKIALTERKPWIRPVCGSLALLGVLGLLSGHITVWGSTLTGGVGGAGKFTSGTVVLSDSIPSSAGTTCLSSPNSAGGITSNSNAACTTYPLSSIVGSAQTVALGNQGSVALGAASAATTGTCGVQELADSSTSGLNTGLPLGGVTYGATGPTAKLPGTTAVTLDGSTGWGETLASQTMATTDSYTIAGWIDPAAKNGVVIGATNAQFNSGQTTFDRMLWIDSSGKVDFGSGTASAGDSIQSTSALTLNTWSFVAVTMKNGTGSNIYINGALASAANGGSKTALAETGYWHLGWAPASGTSFSNPPTVNYFSGSTADLAVFPSALTAANIDTTLYGETSEANFQTGAKTTYSATSLWELQDTGTTLYTGSPANVAGGGSSSGYPDDSGNPGTNAGTGEGYLTEDAAGPIGDTATAFDGTSGWVQTTNSTASPGPQTFSVAAWFKANAQYGVLIGYGNTQGSGVSGNNDRELWLDTSGHMVYAAWPNSTDFYLNSDATTSKNYADDTWHYVVLTSAPVSATVGTVEIYIDGALVAGSASDEAIASSQTAQPYTGWWHIGFSDTGTWSDPPAQDYWAGSLGQVATFATALTAAKVTTLYGESTAATYKTAVTGGVAASNSFWPLDGVQAPSSAPCDYVVLTIQAGTGGSATCLYPVQASPCPGTIPATNYLSVDANVPVTLPTLTFTTATANSPPAGAIGLHVSVPWQTSDRATYGGFVSTISHNEGYVQV